MYPKTKVIKKWFFDVILSYKDFVNQAETPSRKTNYYRIPLKPAIFIFLLIICSANIIFAQPSEVESIDLQWEARVSEISSPDPDREFLLFDGAVFGDSYETIPMFMHREKNADPAKTRQFHIQNPSFVKVSPAERHILEQAGFSANTIQVVQQKEIHRKELYSVVSFYPFRFNAATQDYEKLVSFELVTTHVPMPHNPISSIHQYPSASVLAQGTWFKICVSETGVHQLTFADLAEMGVNTQGLRKENIRIFGNGGGMLPELNSAARITDLRENAIFVSGASHGTFGPGDFLLFYAESPSQWTFNSFSRAFEHQIHLYSNENCYFLTVDQGLGRRITSQPSVAAAANRTATIFQDFAVHHRDLQNLINSGREWYGEVFDVTLSRDFVFRFDDLVVTQQARLRSSVAARASVVSSFVVTAGSGRLTQSVNQIFPAHVTGAFANANESSLSFFPNQANQIAVNVTYNQTVSGARGWLNFLEVNISRQLRFRGPQMGFRNFEVVGPGNVTQFVVGNATPNFTVWDVTDRFHVRQQELSVVGSDANFRQETNHLRHFVAFDGSAFLRPVRRGRVPNQNLHGMRVADLLIVVHKSLEPEAKRLAHFRSQSDGLSVAVVTTEEIFNEFSSGVPDPAAIRNFVKMFYDRATTQAELPRYLLLFGNGTLDNRDILRFGGNLIPTFQSINSLNLDRSFMTDDFFGLLDDSEGLNADGTLDIGIGRFPVRTILEASAVIDKKIRYQERIPQNQHQAQAIVGSGIVEAFADWRNRVLFVADDQDFNRHFIDSEILANRMETAFPEFNVQKIYIDAFQQVAMAGGARYPEVNKAINNAVNQGKLLINYIGHGGFTGLAHERILTFSDIASWNNFYNMPVFMTATCEFSSFDHPDPKEVTAGVRIFLKPDGGAIALFTTTRLAWSGPNMILNRNFIDVAFERDTNGNFLRLGDLIRRAKVRSSGQLENWRIRNFVLLGDPSMTMAYPRQQVITENIPDTIRALQTVTVRGFVADHDGALLTHFNGYVYPTVFDKRSHYRTLAQDNDSFVGDFFAWDRIIFRGRARAIDGRFEFTFKVPANINYGFGGGRISYYADNGNTDAQGYFHQFFIGGSYPNIEPDNTGPDIRLFLNDTTFVNGGITSQNPILLALLHDRSGINITGQLGHDMVAFLNNNSADPLILNNFFQANLDDFTKGRILYSLGNLPMGMHTLSLRVWDTHNNPSIASIEFYVANSAELALENLMNYPNPFSIETFFRFNHNRPFTDLATRIQIFDLTGKLIQEIVANINSPGFVSTPLRWDGTDLYGRMVGNGIYLFRVVVTTPDGQEIAQSQRMVIIR